MRDRRPAACGAALRGACHAHGLALAAVAPDALAPLCALRTLDLQYNGKLKQSAETSAATVNSARDDSAWVSFEPSAPSWLQARPMSSKIQFLTPARVAVETQRATHPN